jgi:SAM-dependent methyltransferase
MSNSSWDKPLIVLTGVQSAELKGMVGNITPSENHVPIRKLCSEIVYRDDIDLIRRKDAQTIFQQTVEDPVELANFLTSAQRAAVIYIDRALKALTTDTEALLPPHLIRYVEWLRETHSLATRGSLRCQDGTDSWFHMGASADEEFLRKFEDSSTDSKLLSAVGNNLSGILLGNTSPLDIMMENDLLSKNYAEAHGVTSLHIIKDWFDLKGHKQPDMRILEVGAGTGSITLPILQILKPQPESTPRFGSYCFTDISAGFLENAGELLKDWQGYVEFKKLDIEKDPQEQGFELESFDVIAANNVGSSLHPRHALTDRNVKVLHATKCISATLKNCYSLLKPGGKLILGEVTQPIEYTSLIYGTLPGWWRSEDGRVGGPCLKTDEWHTQLVNAKFSGLDFVVYDATEYRHHVMSIMVSTKPKPPEAPFQEIVIVTSMNASSDIDALAKALLQLYVEMGSTVEIKDIVAATSLDNDGIHKCKGKFILSLVEIEAPLLSDLPEREFYHLQHLVTQSRGILWITCGAPGPGPANPHLRTVSGFLRVLRSENTQLRLHELHLSRPVDSSLEYLIDNITHVFKSIPSENNTADLDTEIVEEDDRFKIPRLMDEKHKNWDIHTSSSIQPPELQPLLQPGRPLALTIGVPGILDSLHFIDDTSLSSSLAIHEVEVEVKANSLNYRQASSPSG